MSRISTRRLKMAAELLDSSDQEAVFSAMVRLLSRVTTLEEHLLPLDVNT